MVDADRKGVRGGGAAADPNGAAVLVDLGVQFLAAIMEEAFEPFDRLEADHVIVEHRLDQSLVKGKLDEQAGRRPGDVEEEADPVAKAVRAKSLAQRQEMIILHPKQLVRLDQRDQAVRELPVEAFIPAPELILITGKVDESGRT